jgi:hypothetical protein
MMSVDDRASPRGPRALAARKWFAKHGPPDLQPLPLGYDQREALKDGSVSAQLILAWFARSLASLDYNFEMHPSFQNYACGVMASPDTGLYCIKKNKQLRKRFPPRLLPGLGPGLIWNRLPREG